MAANRGPYIITDGLELCLDAANSKSYPGSGASWIDISRNGRNVSLINDPGFTANNGGGIVFDGINDRGTYSSALADSPLTYEVWTNAVASSNAADGFAYILHNNSSGTATGTSYMTIGIDSSNKYYAALNGRFTAMASDVTPNNSNIVQIILTWNGETQKMFINSILKASEALATTPNNFSETTSIGDYRNSTYRMIQGNIYIIKLYSIALDEQQIQNNFNSLKARFAL